MPAYSAMLAAPSAVVRGLVYTHRTPQCTHKFLLHAHQCSTQGSAVMLQTMLLTRCAAYVRPVVRVSRMLDVSGTHMLLTHGDVQPV
jgi:hypothetical protein